MKWSRAEKRAAVVEKLQSHKKPEEAALGLELEHFVVNRSDGRRIFYDEPDGVAELLKEIAAQEGLTPIWINGHIAGAKNKEMALSIEPGAQLELSLHYQRSVQALEAAYKRAMALVLPVLQRHDYGLLSLGVDPVNGVDQVPIIPKERYRIMNDWLGAHGAHSRKMMRLTCALQVSIDYFNEQDFVKKYRVLTAMVPMLYTLFDSAWTLSGQALPKYNVRQEIWRKTDPARTGLIPGVFDPDFSFARYADWLLDQALLFRMEEGHEVELGSLTLDQALDQAQPDEVGGLIDQAMGIVFPDIRVKQFAEIRPMDAVPFPYALGAAALFKGLLYQDEALDRLYRRLCGIDLSIVERGKDSGRDNGIQGYYLSDYFAHWGVLLVDLARSGLSAEEGAYLDPLSELWSNLDTPRTYFERVYRTGGWPALRDLLLAKVDEKGRTHLTSTEGE